MLLVGSFLVLGACGAGELSFPYTGTGGGGGAAATGTGGAGGSIPMACATSMTVLQNSCIGCHNTPTMGATANLDLASAGVAQRLVGQSGAATGGQCAGVMSLLNRGTLPATGILIDKINFKTTCGASMPYPGTIKLPATDLDCLQAWANGLVASVGS
jgi:hypothetical protein